MATRTSIAKARTRPVRGAGVQTVYEQLRTAIVNLELPPGRHALQLVLGDAKHYPFSPPLVSEKITVTIK